MTRKQLERFIATRNKSPHNSNLQFQIDAAACGFEVTDLPEPRRVDAHHYEWDTPHGTLVEQHGRMHYRPKEVMDGIVEDAAKLLGV